MRTSAASLHSALTVVREQQRSLTFAKGILSAIGNPDGNQAEAYRLMTDLYLNLQADIEAAFEDKLLASLNRSASQFSPLLKFATYDLGIHQLSTGSGNFLQENIVDSLLMLDAALQGKCERPDIHIDEKVRTAFSELRDVISELSLPDSLNTLIEKRVGQVERAARDFSFYGIKGVTRSIEELMGAVEVHVEAKALSNPSYKKFRNALVGTVLAVTGAVATTNTMVKEVKELANHVEDAVMLLPNLSEKQSSNGENNK